MTSTAYPFLPVGPEPLDLPLFMGWTGVVYPPVAPRLLGGPEEVDPEPDRTAFRGGEAGDEDPDGPLFEGWGAIPDGLFEEDPWLVWDEGVYPAPQPEREPEPEPEPEPEREPLSCSICMEACGEREVLAVAVLCLHSFHRPCLERWLEESQSCPLCRERVPEFGGVDLCDAGTASELRRPSPEQADLVAALMVLAGDEPEEEARAQPQRNV